MSEAANGSEGASQTTQKKEKKATQLSISFKQFHWLKWKSLFVAPSTKLKEEKWNQSTIILFNEWLVLIWFQLFSSPAAHSSNQFKNVLIDCGRARPPFFSIQHQTINEINWIDWLNERRKLFAWLRPNPSHSTNLRKANFIFFCFAGVVDGLAALLQAAWCSVHWLMGLIRCFVSFHLHFIQQIQLKSTHNQFTSFLFFLLHLFYSIAFVFVVGDFTVQSQLISDNKCQKAKDLHIPGDRGR